MASLLKLSLRDVLLLTAVIGQGGVIVYQQRQLHYASLLPIQPHVRQQILERGENECALKPIFDSGSQSNTVARQNTRRRLSNATDRF